MSADEWPAGWAPVRKSYPDVRKEGTVTYVRVALMVNDDEQLECVALSAAGQREIQNWHLERGGVVPIKYLAPATLEIELKSR